MRRILICTALAMSLPPVILAPRPLRAETVSQPALQTVVAPASKAAPV